MAVEDKFIEKNYKLDFKKVQPIMCWLIHAAPVTGRRPINSIFAGSAFMVKYQKHELCAYIIEELENEESIGLTIISEKGINPPVELTDLIKKASIKEELPRSSTQTARQAYEKLPFESNNGANELLPDLFYPVMTKTFRPDDVLDPENTKKLEQYFGEKLDVVREKLMQEFEAKENIKSNK